MHGVRRMGRDKGDKMSCMACEGRSRGEGVLRMACERRNRVKIWRAWREE